MRLLLTLHVLLSTACAGYLSSSPNHLAKRSDNTLTLCSGPGGSGTCQPVTIQDGALKAGFDIDGGDLNKQLGFGPQSGKLETPGLICGIAHQKRTQIVGFFNLLPHCQGDRVIVTNEAFVDFTGKLFQNVQCLGCFKSPGA